MRNIKTLFIILIFSVFSLSKSFAFDQPVETPSIGIFDVLNYQEVLEVNLEMDLVSIISDRRNNGKYPATFSFMDKNGEEQNWNIKVNLRGKFRRLKCAEMPPLKLNFKKGDLKEKGLNKFDDLKLVTHCVQNEKEAKELLLREYLAYKLFNEITEESFRVQLLKINYIDHLSKESKQQWAILIEDTAQMRERIGAEKATLDINLPADDFETINLKKVALYQYMIGNLDWDIRSARNIKIVKKGEKMIAIPYDFDFSFFVDAPYVLIDPSFQIVTKADRVYLGFEKDLENMKEVIAYFKSKKRKLYKTVRGFKYLSGSVRKEILNYLDTFYFNLDEIRPRPKSKLVNNVGE